MSANYKNGGKWITAHKRLAIHLRDGMECIYCGCDLHNCKPKEMTLDHLKCKEVGGSNHESNLITACRSCNSSRQDMPLHRFADAKTRKAIVKNTRKPLAPYITLAKAMIAGRTGDAA
jgi:5-methylcytosine-specific restriction endonuclease McrA